MRRAALAAEQMDLSELRCLIICGFGGGLRSDILPGSLVVADSVLDTTVDILTPCVWAARIQMSDSSVIGREEYSRRLGAVPPRQGDGFSSYREPRYRYTVHRGPLATGDRVLIRKTEKAALAERTGACAVDMETAGAVRVAEQHGVPWLAIRAITDGADDEMPLDFNALSTPDGDPDRGRVLRATLTHPWKIPALIRLGTRSSLAARNLALYLEDLTRMSRIWQLVLVISLLATGLLNISAHADTGILTQADAVAFALQRSPQVRAAQAERDTAQVQADRERPVARPTMTAVASGTLQGPRVTLPAPENATVQPEGVGRLDFLLEQVLYRAGLGAARQRYAASSALAQENYRKALADLTRSVRKTYLDVLRAEAGVQTAQAGVDTARLYQDLVQRQIGAGVAKPVDAETAKTQVGEATEGLQRATSGLDLARKALNYTLGRSLDTTLMLEAPSALPTVPANPDAAIAYALQNRSELVVLELNLRLAQAGVSLARTQAQPTVTARGQLTEQTPTALSHEHYYGATLEVRWPLLSGGKVRQDTREAQSQVDRLMAERDHARLGIELDVRQAWQKMRDARSRIELAQEQRQSQERLLQVATKAYEVGRGTALEVQAAQREVRNIRERELLVLYDLHAAAIDFACAQGRAN